MAGKAGKGQRRAGKEGTGRRQAPVLRALQTLSLTDEQKTKLKPLQEKFQTDLKEARADTDKAAGRKKASEINKKFRADLEQTRPEWALAYQFDVVLRGADATPMEEHH